MINISESRIILNIVYFCAVFVIFHVDKLIQVSVKSLGMDTLIKTHPLLCQLRTLDWKIGRLGTKDQLLSILEHETFVPTWSWSTCGDYSDFIDWALLILGDAC